MQAVQSSKTPIMNKRMAPILMLYINLIKIWETIANTKKAKKILNLW